MRPSLGSITSRCVEVGPWFLATGSGSTPLQPRVDGLAFHGEHAERALMGAPQGLHSRGPVQGRLSFRGEAVAQIQIDQLLVRDPCFRRQPLEVRDDIYTEPNGDLLFQVSSVGVPATLQLRKIVFLSHSCPR